MRGAAEAKKASNETEKETVKSTAKNTTKGVEKGAEKDAEKGKKKVDKKTEKKVDKKPETESKVTNENEDVKPKKPLSSYMLFCREKRSSVMSQFPGTTADRKWRLEYKAKEVVTKLGEMWQALSDKEKAKYVSLAQENREQYAKQMKEWREQHPDSITHSDMKQKRTQRAHIPEEFIIEKTTELPGIGI